MTVLAGADIRGFYARLDLRLSERATREAPVRCFAAPDEHRRDDRDPSCSVNLTNGAFNCHACGAHGGAYDAAIAAGHSPRGAIDLMIDFGLIERRTRLTPANEPPVARRRTPAQRPRSSIAAAPSPSLLGVNDHDVARYTRQLARRPALISRLARERGWDPATVADLELGYDRGRITIPVRNAHGELRGLVRYQPDRSARPKMLAVRGTRNGLIPHPATETSPEVLLVEGPPDMIAARSRGLAAIAVPGTEAWRPQWAHLFAEREVTIVMDADAPGRATAQRVAEALSTAAGIRVLDLAPNRDDGYDLTDWLLEHPYQRELLTLTSDAAPQRSCGMTSP
jgi:hypothetical protein